MIFHGPASLGFLPPRGMRHVRLGVQLPVPDVCDCLVRVGDAPGPRSRVLPGARATRAAAAVRKNGSKAVPVSALTS
jgi:hypothetical protein